MTPVSLSPLIARLDLPADYNGEELVLGWRRVNADFTSRGGLDRKSTRLNSSHLKLSRMPSSA